MNYKIELPEFEGPMDLLLHLIKEDNISIFDISIDRVTKQYLEYLNIMEEMNLDIASEYLVMASELIEMKSKSLLPKKETNDEDEYEEDPKEQLINKLLEYEKYKNISKTFQELESIRNSIYTRHSDEILDYKIESNDDYGIDVNDLINAFQKFLDKKELDKPLNTKIEKKEYSVSKRCHEIKKIISAKKEADFEDLFEILNKEYVVVTFLAILSLSKKQEILITQNNNFNQIKLKLKENL